MEKKFSQSLIKANSIDEKKFTIDFVMTIEEKDRHGDIVDVASIKLDNFMKNPVVLPQHDHSAPSIGRVIDAWVESIEGKQALIGRVKFAVEEYDLARTYWNLYSNGYMNAVSIGFIPERCEMVDGVFVLYGSEILELSCVSIPANQLALAKSNGIDVKPILNAGSYMKDIRDTLIAVKNLIEEEAPVEAKAEEKPEADAKVETPVEHTAEEKNAIARQNAIRVLNKAIRQLR